jgi:5'-deoxynucleotidase YfbR-like HD superfamily hydrolase
MAINPFPPELRTMAVVPRWPIVMTTLKDNVATHTFFVATYSYMVAEVIDWSGPRDYLLMNALMHDNDETISADVPGTIKSILFDKEASEEFLAAKTEERMGGLVRSYYKLEDRQSEKHIREADAIVLVADKLDALLFLIVNVKMGNQMVVPAIEGGKKSLEASWRALPSDKDTLDRTWNTVVLPSIAEHYERGGRGVAPGVYI